MTFPGKKTWRFIAQLSCLVTVLGCQGAEEAFRGLRVEDRCDGEWPVCNTVIGCFLGDKSLVKGQFPGKQSVAVRVFEPSTVTVSFFLTELKGAGEQTVITIYEDACHARTRREVTGKSFFAEFNTQSYVSREADVSGVGDHLIEVESDARTKYEMKVDVFPLRLKDLSSQ